MISDTLWTLSVVIQSPEEILNGETPDLKEGRDFKGETPDLKEGRDP